MQRSAKFLSFSCIFVYSLKNAAKCAYTPPLGGKKRQVLFPKKNLLEAAREREASTAVSFWSRFVSLARIEMKKKLPKQDGLILEHLKRLIQFRVSSKSAPLVLVDFRHFSHDGIEKTARTRGVDSRGNTIASQISKGLK